MQMPVHEPHWDMFGNAQQDFHTSTLQGRMTGTMDSAQFSSLSSLRGEHATGDYMQAHYKESYRLAIDCLLSKGRESYTEFLKEERIGNFLSEEELVFITSNAKELPPQNHEEEISSPTDSQSSSGTYWPVHSDVDAPALELGWPEIMHEKLQTNIDLLYHPPRPNSPTIKEVILKNIRNARQVIAIVMDMFTDVDILKETVDASTRGVPVYVLLDDFHLKHFLTAAENQDVKLQHLRNMKVRTVKGEDYLSRTGTKFHGAMEQKFILVDCHTVIYGSYRFTWSCAKLNLSMVQVITGHLVKTYDEEFRTLYARSTVPAELCQPDPSLPSNGSHTLLGWPKYSPHSSIDRRDQLRHTLDSVYRKTCERNLYTRDCNDNHYVPLIDHDIGLQNHMSKFESAASNNYLKRHSYAGERHEGYVPQNVRARASNWNICRETGIGKNNHPLDNNYLVPQMYRSQKLRQSYNGNDKQILSMQQDMPTLEKTSKSFMRTWRIESYLQNPDMPFNEPSDYLDQFEPSNSFMQGRMRSLVYRPAIPEQLESNSQINSTPSFGSRSSALHNPLRYSSMQWNPPVASESNRISNEDFILKRKSLQIMDDYNSGKNSYPSAYASLGRANRGPIATNPDVRSDTWHKRHSVADPRSNSTYTQDSSGGMYGAFTRMQMDRGSAAVNAKHSGYGSNLNEDQRSVSHYDVKSMTDTKSPCTSIWRDPPSRSLSASTLGVDDRDLATKSSRLGSQHFLKKSTKKIKSFLNLPGRKEDQVESVGTPSVTSDDSTDTIKAEDEVSVKHHHSNTSLGHEQTEVADVKYSRPRFETEDHQHTPQLSSSETTSHSKLGVGNKKAIPDVDIPGWSKDRKLDNRLYSRFEPFCSIQKKQSSYSPNNSLEKTKNPPSDHNFPRLGRGHHENKIGKFFHRVGNLIHKTK
ncbi:protein FAM83B [Syngnathus scovelli]|uniref:protein FAM83B n=1 Tax=Syngnathus scovelli TaxID=161590 RepID=UPI0021103926|nr:protein FAM83B [Syngnathus scovelli]